MGTLRWRAEARCRALPPAMFLPTDARGVARAKRVCAQCAVSGACLEYALEQLLDHGVWGGTSERERRRILKARGVVRSPSREPWRLIVRASPAGGTAPAAADRVEVPHGARPARLAVRLGGPAR